MTNTNTEDVESTVRQVAALAAAGSELVRVTVNTPEAAKAVPEIVRQLRDKGEDMPIIRRFSLQRPFASVEVSAMRSALAKYRINPGNVGVGTKHDENFRRIIEIALENDKPVRIGVNWG